MSAAIGTALAVLFITACVVLGVALTRRRLRAVRLPEVSLGYTCMVEPCDGEFDGEPFEAEQRDSPWMMVGLSEAEWHETVTDSEREALTGIYNRVEWLGRRPPPPSTSATNWPLLGDNDSALVASMPEEFTAAKRAEYSALCERRLETKARADQARARLSQNHPDRVSADQASDDYDVALAAANEADMAVPRHNVHRSERLLGRAALHVFALAILTTACGPDIFIDFVGSDPGEIGDTDSGSEADGETETDAPPDSPSECEPGSLYCQCDHGECETGLACDIVAGACFEDECAWRDLVEFACDAGSCLGRWDGTELWSRVWDASLISALEDVDPSTIWGCEPDPDVDACKLVDDQGHIGCYRYHGDFAVAVAPSCAQTGWLDVGCAMSADAT